MIQNIPIDKLHPHPDNPRYEMSDEEKQLQDGTHELFIAEE